MLTLEFSTANAAPLSSAIVVGLGLGNVLQFLPARHPLKEDIDRPLIDYWLAFMLTPLMLVGTVIGVYLNAVSPEWLLIAMLLVVMGITVWRTIRRAIKVYRG